MNTIKFADCKEELLSDPEVKKEYDSLRPYYELQNKLIKKKFKNSNKNNSLNLINK